MDQTNRKSDMTIKISTLTAWAKILYDDGKIDLKQYTAMVEKFKALA